MSRRPSNRTTIYVNPPNTLMLVRDRNSGSGGAARIRRKVPAHRCLLHLPGEEFHFQAVGVVLSGTASDGTLGLKTIKAEGGITFAQNQSAKFDSMPRSAIAAGVVDFILSPRRIAEELAAISHRTRNLNHAERELTGDGATLHRVLLLLRQSTGVDFSQYKQTDQFAPPQPPHGGAQAGDPRTLSRTSARKNRTRPRPSSTTC